MSYVPHQVAQALRNDVLESEDLDLYLDIEEALSRLPTIERTLLKLYGIGLSPEEALKRLDLSRKNPQRTFNKALRAFTDLLNGKTVSVGKGEEHGN